MHRFIGAFDLSPKVIVVDDKELLHQWSKVLRFKTGEQVILCDGRKQEIVGRIISLDKQQVQVEVVERRANKAESKMEIVLYCAILKRENFELVVQKAVETGVARIVPVRTERTVKLNIKRERLEAIIKEAAEQSGRGVMPTLDEPLDFAQAMTQSSRQQARFFFDVGAQHFYKMQAINRTSVAVFIGPEGGWSEAERAAAADAGLMPVSLGERVLRGETAAIVACFLLGE